jgi:superfamily II DNA or RNA helicase
MVLRPYQNQILSAVDAGWASYTKQLVVSPTGSGKTLMFSKLTEQTVNAGGRSLTLVDQDELVTQAVEKLRAATGIYAQIEKAEYSASLLAPAVVASVQTMARRLHKFPSNHFDMVIADEADKSVSDQWQRVLRHFDGHARICGFTATPWRTDEVSLLTYYQHIAAEVSLRELINQGFLARIEAKLLPLRLNLNGVRTVTGDLDKNQVHDRLEPALERVVELIKEHAPNRKIMVFVPLIKTSLMFVEIARKAGILAEHIDGTSEDRKEKLERFSRGDFQLICNSLLLTRGYDEPSIDCVVMLRPTKSQTLYFQAIGRGTRIHPGKENLLLLDFLYQTEKHFLIRPAHLMAPSAEVAEEMTEIMEQEAVTPGGGGDVQEALDLEGLASEAALKREAKLRRSLEEKSRREAMSCDVMQFCQAAGADTAASWVDTEDWHRAKPTAAQLALIGKAGIDVAGVRSFGHASAVIDAIQNRRSEGKASWKQVKLLRKFRIENPEQLSKEQAGRIISERLSSFGRKRETTAWEASAA